MFESSMAISNDRLVRPSVPTLHQLRDRLEQPSHKPDGPDHSHDRPAIQVRECRPFVVCVGSSHPVCRRPRQTGWELRSREGGLSPTRHGGNDHRRDSRKQTSHSQDGVGFFLRRREDHTAHVSDLAVGGDASASACSCCVVTDLLMSILAAIGEWPRS